MPPLVWARTALVLLVGFSAGCPAPTAPASSPTPPVSSTPSPERQAEAKALAQALGKRLKERLQAAIAAEGAVGGLNACSAEAQDLTAAVSSEGGAKVGRTSQRLRNPKNVAPAWASEWVAAKSEAPHFSQAEDGSLRALLPIKTAPLCLSCHGAADSLQPEVTSALAKLYPSDQATGFAAGDLRGWFWVELPPAESAPQGQAKSD